MSITQDWFPKSLLNEIIKKQFNGDLEIVSTNMSYLLTPGENYTGELLKIEVSFSEKNRNTVQSLSMICKSLLDNEFVKQLNAESGFFDCELGIYSEVLPMMKKLEFSKKVAPTAYHTSSDLKKIIVVEDLVPLDYKMANRQEGLDLQHCLLAVEKLAYFHAASLALYEKDPKLIEQYNRGLFYKSSTLDKLITILFQETVNVCKREPSLHKYHKKITEDIKEKIYDSPKRDLKFNVLNHGDFWCNNFMFHYDSNGRVDDILFVDFQGSVFASPFLDIHYFIAASTNVEVKEKHINDILHYYYEAFVENAKILKLKSTVPNWTDFKKDFCNKAYIGFAVSCILLPIIKANKMNDASITNFLENGEEGSFRHHCFTNSAYIDIIKFVFPLYDNLEAFIN
ncbi:hypothetical protein RN001_013740 [Aquatica leii]|uniref:CHK kinase-like domain-containing protein n=1 Tax=Aquatica leii TaxID=1421715 RepID=A0AAN7SNU9_9COLE|nr:hypothetical protein RN001_013740 [Aquatica leii]